MFTEEQQAKIDKMIEDANKKKDDEYAALKQNSDSILQEKREMRDKAKAAEDKAAQSALDKAKADKDIDTVTASYEEKLSAATATLEKLQGDIKRGKIKSIADHYVNANVQSDELAQESIGQAFSKRLDVRDGKTVVLDSEGNLTAMTVEDLKTEFSKVAKYSKYLKTSNVEAGAKQIDVTEVNKGANKPMSAKEKALAILKQQK